MIDDRKLESLRELLSMHGEVIELRPLPEVQNAQCAVLATMESPEIAHSAQARHGFTIFGYDSLIIGDEWIKHHLAASLETAR